MDAGERGNGKRYDRHRTSNLRDAVEKAARVAVANGFSPVIF